ncbi:MAG: carboxypeptidase-like regulatory domain-containing protein [Candidatus Acidiferrales bacterium]
MNRSMIRALGLGIMFCLGLCAIPAPLVAAPNTGKITGLVVDSAGTPQMGATVVVSANQLVTGLSFELLTNDRGRFSTVTLPAGLYSVKVTLAGFLPVIEQDIQVSSQHTTLLQIVLGSVFTSFESLRRQPDQEVSSDEWGWVLRASAATRPVLRWQDGDVVLGVSSNHFDNRQNQQDHTRVEFSSGSDHPGSISNVADSPGTAFAYDYGLGELGSLRMAGQFSYSGTSEAGGFVTQWLPSGDSATGSVTTLLLRESRLGAAGPSFRGLRMSHDSSFQLGDHVSIRYGADFIAAGLQGTTTSLRPRTEVALRFSPTWQASMLVTTNTWQDSAGAPGDLQSTLNQLDAFPTLLLHGGRPVLEDNMHEELAVEHDLSKKASITAAVFHDRSAHTAVFGRGDVSGPDYLPDYFSDVFAYDAGELSSVGARLVYQQKLSGNLDMTMIYAYGGVLAPNESPVEAALRNELNTQYRSSAAARFTAKIPRTGTKIVSGYKWISGSAVSQQDSYGQSIYHLDPYLSIQIHQKLPGFIPGHAEILADCGNLLAQGYVTLATTDGQVVLVPTYRFFRGGLSFQF